MENIINVHKILNSQFFSLKMARKNSSKCSTFNQIFTFLCYNEKMYILQNIFHKLFHWKRLDQNSNLPFNIDKELFLLCFCIFFSKENCHIQTSFHTRNIEVKHQQRNSSLLLPKCTKRLTNPLPPLPQINHILFMACIILGSCVGKRMLYTFNLQLNTNVAQNLAFLSC